MNKKRPILGSWHAVGTSNNKKTELKNGSKKKKVTTTGKCQPPLLATETECCSTLAEFDGTNHSLIGLSWPTRLTIILIGASILFSLFFGLEFIIAKLVGALLSGAAGSQNASGVSARSSFNSNKPESPIQGSHCRALVHSRLDWLGLFKDRELNLSSSKQLSKALPSAQVEANCTQSSETKPQVSLDFGSNLPEKSKTGVNFELIYEAELRLSPDEREYILLDDDFDGAERQIDHHRSINNNNKRRALLVQPELKLKQLLDGYHLAMPFNPDIWTISRPEQHLDLLTGQIDKCSHQLRLLLSSFERALCGDAQINGSCLAADSENCIGNKLSNPLERLGHQHYQLMKLLDSFGRPEAGTLSGHPFWLGSYLQCKQLNELPVKRQIKLFDQNSAINWPLRTRYCVGKLSFKSWLRENDQLNMLSNKYQSSIKMGLCLPDSCDSLALLQLTTNDSHKLEQLKELIFKIIALNLPSESNRIYSSQYMNLTDVYCLPEEQRRHLGACAFLLLLFVSSWLLCMLVCTKLRQTDSVKQNKMAKIADIMAIDVNMSLFLSDKQREDTSEPKLVVNLNVLDSVKHLGCAGVIMAHVLLTYLTLGTAYNNTIEHIGKDMRTMLLLSLNNIVDTFFVISGLLVSYLTFKKLHKPLENKTSANDSQQQLAVNPSFWAKFFKATSQYVKVIMSRYARMAPLYFLVYSFAKTISVHLGAGPLWDYATNQDSLRGLCRQESWLWPIFFASDFKPLVQHCVPPAWSISVDLQFFTLLPIFVAILRAGSSVASHKQDSRHKKFIVNLVLVSMIAISTLMTMIQYKSLLDYVSLRDFAKLRLHVFTVLITHVPHAYSQPQNRMGPILIGLIGGHLLYEFERNQQDKKQKNSNKWPYWMRGKAFKLILVITILFVVAPCFVQLRERARQWQANYDEQLAGHLISRDFQPIDWITRQAVGWLLFLQTTTIFDCYLALGGFILIKPLWSVCNCIIFLRLATDLNQSALARFMSLKWWHIISKLNYAILLIHFELIAYESMSRLSMAQPITWSYLLCKFSFAYLFSLFLATPLYILFEQPSNRLMSHYLGQWK